MRNRVIGDLVAFQNRRQERVLEHVRGGIGGGEGDRDDEVGGDEAEEDKHEELALPPGEQPLQHGDRAFATRAFARRPAGRPVAPQTA